MFNKIKINDNYYDWGKIIDKIDPEIEKICNSNLNISNNVSYFLQNLDQTVILNQDSSNIIIGYPDSYRFSYDDLNVISNILNKLIMNNFEQNFSLTLEMI